MQKKISGEKIVIYLNKQFGLSCNEIKEKNFIPWEFFPDVLEFRTLGEIYFLINN